MNRSSPLRRKSRTRPVSPKRASRVGKVAPVIVTREGREICTKNRKGRLEYKLRILAMCRRQKWQCCLYGICPECPGHLSESEATFEHEGGRGMNGGKRDDRIVLPDGRWQNGAAHLRCNNWKGSRAIHYNRREAA